MLNRRSLLIGLVAAPAVVRFESLMKIVPVRLFETSPFPEFPNPMLWRVLQRDFDEIMGEIARSVNIPARLLTTNFGNPGDLYFDTSSGTMYRKEEPC